MTTFCPRRVTILVMPPRIGPKTPVRVFLQEWREHHGLTQEQLGGRISTPVDKGTVSRWETAEPGRLTAGVIAAFAEALGRHVTEMYRLPPADDEPVSLDVLAAGLSREQRNRAVGFVEGLKGRKAS